ncbi:uncharacterized protein LAJ45_06420 [Morchella importuna]|uniref:uncharacterized protein n=1 Tax=Morchella importuna TaxID=1174673 RepID=UPI001E8D10C3|nr:uncharacterized protein LAJ45_06420 [Morchella importuna]KAH8149341.1 hypothetical protein LAJ45_06420 [Morchella importuna]
MSSPTAGSNLRLPNGQTLVILKDASSHLNFSVEATGSSIEYPWPAGSIEVTHGSPTDFPSATSDKITLFCHDPESSPAVYRLWLALYWYFCHPAPKPAAKKDPRKPWVVNINTTTGLFSDPVNVGLGAAIGLLSYTSPSPTAEVHVYAARSSFWQIPWEAVHERLYYPKPLEYIITNGIRHPLRPRPQQGTLYKRWVPSLKEFISFRLASAETDAELVHRWMNDPRVAEFWGEDGGDVEKTREFLKKGLESSHCYPVIGCWNDEPFGYFEVYWVKEDNLGKFATGCGPWERGVHCLVGEQKFRGPHRVGVWISSLVHYMFLDDPRTQTVMLEPRVDNEKFIKYLTEAGFYKEKEFAFPHKQAALMKLEREAWETGPLL